MKKILINTALDDLLLIAIENEKTIDLIHIKNLVKKADNLKNEFDNLLKKVNWSINDISSFYVIKGPGSFMGVRVGLLFARTIAQILNIKIYTLDSLSFISKNKPGEYSIDAKSGEVFSLIIDENSSKTFSTKKGSEYTSQNISTIIQDLPSILDCFQEVENLDSVEPLYMKEPKVN